jgi:hypothetical protein
MSKNAIITPQHDAEVRHETYVKSYITLKVETSRRILTLSAAAIGLLVTILANYEGSAEFWFKAVLGGSFLAFITAVVTTGATLHHDPEYLLLSSKSLNIEGDVDGLSRLRYKIKVLGRASKICFLIGLLGLLIVALKTISQL